MGIDAADEGSPTIDSTELIGNWKRVRCSARVDESMTVWDETQITSARQVYASNDLTCAQAMLRIESVFDYVVPGLSTTVPGAAKIDLAVRSVKLMPLTIGQTAFLNQIGYCGKQWTYLEWTDVTGKNCRDQSGDWDQYDWAGRKYDDIYQVTMNRTRLSFGDSSTGTSSSDANRPTALGIWPFIKS